jgi:hypothetical protein
MNKMIKYSVAVVLALSLLASCREDEKDPWQAFRSPNGAVVSWSSINSSIINFADINNSAYDVDLIDISGNVDEYELFVVYQGDTAAFETITSFPANLDITAAELVTAFTNAGFTLDVNDFSAGDRVDCFATVTDKNGVVYEVTDIGNDLLTNPGMRTMHRFNFFFSCPFDPAEAEGTYFVTFDEWGDYATPSTIPMTVTADATSVTVEGLYSNAWIGVGGHQDYDVKIDINVANGIATVAAQPAYSTAWWPSTFGVASVDGTGFVFSCSGTITVDLQHRVSAGTFSGGPYTITLQK